MRFGAVVGDTLMTYIALRYSVRISYRYISDSKGSLMFMHVLCDTAQDISYSESKWCQS
jgi:hypothetical protein